ncbi:hypothetical protein GCM10022253_02880 [Sphingomonas endophytica]
MMVLHVVRNTRATHSVIPAQAGIYGAAYTSAAACAERWLSACAGMTKRAGVATILALLAATTTSATAQTQADMNAQAAASYKTADAAMNAQWPRTYAAMKRRDATARDGFGYAAATLASQRAWLTFRDKQCTIEGGEFAGGSLQPMARLQCLARLTKERTTQLKDLMWQR